MFLYFIFYNFFLYYIFWYFIGFYFILLCSNLVEINMIFEYERNLFLYQDFVSMHKSHLKVVSFYFMPPLIESKKSFSNYVIDPCQIFSNICVDSRNTFSSTSNSPWNNSSNVTSSFIIHTNQRASGIAYNEKWYFVTKVVLTYCEKKIVLAIEKNFHNFWDQ